MAESVAQERAGPEFQQQIWESTVSSFSNCGPHSSDAAFPGLPQLPGRSLHFPRVFRGAGGGFLSVKATPSTYLQRKELSQTTAGECRTPRSPQHRWAPVAGLCEAFRLLSPLRGSVAVLGCPTGRASWAISERSPPASLSGQS